MVDMQLIELETSPTKMQDRLTEEWFVRYFQSNQLVPPPLEDRSKWNPIFYFALVWNLFESVVCERNANKQTIDESVGRHEKSLRSAEYQKFFGFFRRRYMIDEGFEERFKRLFPSNLRGTDRKMKEHLERSLQNNEHSSSDLVKSLLYISYRVRNNFFHGNKSLNEVINQTELFRMVIWVLITYIDDCRNGTGD